MRIVAVSDQHAHLPQIPRADLLIVAGDVCPDRIGPFLAMHEPVLQKQWFDRKIRPWVAAAPVAHTVLTWGNHDWCGQTLRHRQDANLRIVVDSRTIVLHGQQRVSVWATPWSNQFMSWAFMKPPAELAEVYARIPNDIDILVSHQPPFGYGDAYPDLSTGRVVHLGSRELLAAIDRTRPKIVICGHLHSGHGEYERHGTRIFNVSVVNEQYQLVHPPTEIEL